MVRKRHEADEGFLDLGTPATPGEWGKKFPELWDFLFACEYDDGDPRVPGSLILFRDGSKVKACLSDKDSELVAFVTGDSADGLFEAIEAGLRDDDLDWRQQKPRRSR